MRPRLDIFQLIPKSYRPVELGYDTIFERACDGSIRLIAKVEGVLFLIGRLSQAYKTQVCQFSEKLEGAGDGKLIYTSLYERSGLDVGSKAGTKRRGKCMYSWYHIYVRGKFLLGFVLV